MSSDFAPPIPAHPRQLRTIADVLERAAASTPQMTALIVDDRSLTMAELRRRARALATGLRRRGLAPGDHIACWLPNGPEFVECFYAAAYIGAVLVPINTWYGQREFEYVLRQSDARALISLHTWNDTPYAERIITAAPELRKARKGIQLSSPGCPRLERVIIAGGELDWAENYEGLIEAHLDAEAAGTPASPQDLALLLYTSGTTASPKAVMSTHGGLLEDAVLLGERMRIPEGSRYFCPAPFFHAGGAVFCLLAGHAFLSCVVANARFTADAAVAQILKHRCNVIGGFDTMYVRMLDAVGEAEPLDLDVGWWATGPAALFERVEERLGLRLVNLYGLTEGSGNVTSTPPEWPVQERASSQGVPLEGREVVIVPTRAERPAAPNEVGEIRVGGWGLMTGYYKDPEATRNAFDSHGRLRTGDLGFLDDRGRLHFVGRGRDKLKVGGENVAPAEIENVCYEHPSVDEIAVVGMDDELYGEVPVAFVKVAAGHELDEDGVRLFVRERLASFKVPRRVHFVQDFPRSSTGKVRKDALRERLRAREE